MPFNEQPELDGDTIVVALPGATHDGEEIMYFAFDIGTGTISKIDGDGNATTVTGDTVLATTTGTSTANQTTEGLGSAFFGDTNEGPL